MHQPDSVSKFVNVVIILPLMTAFCVVLSNFDRYLSIPTLLDTDVLLAYYASMERYLFAQN